MSGRSLARAWPRCRYASAAPGKGIAGNAGRRRWRRPPSVTPRCTPRWAGRSRSGCGRRRRCRRGPPAASTWPPPGWPADRRPARGCRRGSIRRAVRRRCAARSSAGLSSLSSSPRSTARISSRMRIIASQKRSSSAFDSLSVGSSSACRPPGRTWSAHGSRSPSGAWPRRRR